MDEGPRPAPGGSAPEHPPGAPSGGREQEESPPTAIGTLFILIVFLMALAGLWGIMFLELLDR